MYEVKLKPGHPTGLYHRVGLEFSASGPKFLEEVPKAVRKDRWLIVSRVEKQTPWDPGNNPDGKTEGGQGGKFSGILDRVMGNKSGEKTENKEGGEGGDKK